MGPPKLNNHGVYSSRVNIRCFSKEKPPAKSFPVEPVSHAPVDDFQLFEVFQPMAFCLMFCCPSKVWLEEPNFQHLGIERQKCEDLTFFIFQSKYPTVFVSLHPAAKNREQKRSTKCPYIFFRWKDATYLLSKWYIVLTRPPKQNVPLGGGEENERNVKKR